MLKERIPQNLENYDPRQERTMKAGAALSVLSHNYWQLGKLLATHHYDKIIDKLQAAAPADSSCDTFDSCLFTAGTATYNS